MQKLKCPSFKISTQNLLLSVSYCLQHTMKCHIYCCSEIVSCSRCLVRCPCQVRTVVRRFSSRRPAVPKTRSLAADDAAMQRIRLAGENILGSTVRLSRRYPVKTSHSQNVPSQNVPFLKQNVPVGENVPSQNVPMLMT